MQVLATDPPGFAVHDAVAVVGWVLLVLGWIFRRNRTLHLRMVIPGMAVDLGLVLYLEITRSVIARTVTVEYTAYQWTHIVASAAATFLYIPVIVLGVKLIRRTASPVARAWHVKLALLALAFRTVGFAFMWAV